MYCNLTLVVVNSYRTSFSIVGIRMGYVCYVIEYFIIFLKRMFVCQFQNIELLNLKRI